MSSRLPQWLLATIIGLALSGCASGEQSPPVEKAPPADSQPYAGWYMQHAGQGTFQPCGQQSSWRVSASADLPARAKAFGLDEDTPVYVRLQGALRGDAIEVIRVEQFGSPTPVRNCGMTGVVIPAD